LKLESVLEKRQIGHVTRRTDRFHLGDNSRQLACGHRSVERFLERVDVAHRGCVRHAGGGGDPRQVAAGGRGRRKAADRQQTLVVEHHVDQVPRAISRQRREAAEIHEKRAVAVEYDHLAVRFGQRDAQAHGRGQPHRMLQVEEIRPVADRLQFRRDGSHDRHDDRVL
jgi:hypothetical protein